MSFSMRWVQFLNWLNTKLEDRSFLVFVFLILWGFSSWVIYNTKPMDEKMVITTLNEVDSSFSSVKYKDMGSGRVCLQAPYDALKLFTLSNDEAISLKWGGESWKEWWGEGWCDNWANRVTRILVWILPIFTILSFLQFFLRRFMLRAIGRVPFLKDVDGDHIVIIGLGAWGQHYADALHESNKQVVVIEKDPTEAAINKVIDTWVNTKVGDKKPIYLITGDCLSNSDLDKAGVKSAKKVLPMLKSDGENIDIAYKVRDLIKDSKAPPVILLPVDDIRLSTSLASYSRFADHNSATEIRFFNIMQQAAVRHLMEHPPELYAHIFKQENVHIAIYGLGDFAINLIYVIAHIGHFRTWPMESATDKMTSKKARITIYDQKSEKDIRGDLKALFPNLNEVIEVEFVSTELMNINFDNVLNMQNKEQDAIHKGKKQDITQHIFCISNETVSVRYATKLRKYQMRHKNKNVPIFVRSLDGKGVSNLIESNEGNDEWPDNIYPLVLLNKKLADEGYFSDPIDRIAKAFNNAQDSPDFDVREKKMKELVKDDNKKWGETSADFKHSSYYQAFYLSTRLRSVGYRWQVGKRDLGNPSAWSKKEELHYHIAHLEHDRWKSERWILGWTNKGKRTFDDIAKIHEELEAKDTNKAWNPDYDIRQAKHLDFHLAKAKCHLVKMKVVGLISSEKQPKEYKKEEIIIFNLLDKGARDKVEELLKEGYRKENIIALLPLPIEIVKGLLNLLKDVSEIPKGSEGAENLTALVKRISPSDKSLSKIMRLSGKVGTYIEMPLEHPYDMWKKNDLQVLDWFEKAFEEADDYIRFRSDNLDAEKQCDEKKDTTFLYSGRL